MISKPHLKLSYSSVIGSTAELRFHAHSSVLSQVHVLDLRNNPCHRIDGPAFVNSRGHYSFALKGNFTSESSILRPYPYYSNYREFFRAIDLNRPQTVPMIHPGIAKHF